MSQRIEDGGPAYPVAWQETNEYGVTFTYRETGMSLRDWFAGHALAGLLASNARYGGKTDNREALSADAYASADAMLSARQMGAQTGGASA